jgi:hypothetical protein
MKGFFRGVVLGSITSAVVLLAASAFGGTGIGAVFNLGRTNTVNHQSTLKGNAAAPMLQVANGSTQSGATGVGINVAPGHAPLKVNSSTKVARLNADRLDGIDSSGFVLGGGSLMTAALAPSARAPDVEVLNVPAFFRLGVGCQSIPDGPEFDSKVVFKNLTADAGNLFIDDGSSFPIHFDLAANGERSFTVLSGGQEGLMFQFQAVGGRVVTIWVNFLDRQFSPAGDCHIQAMALVGA